MRRGCEGCRLKQPQGAVGWAKGQCLVGAVPCVCAGGGGGVSPVPCIPLAAKVRNRQGCGILCLLLPPTPLAWGWDASSRVSSGRNQGWLEEEAELQERNARTDGRVDRRSPGGMANTRLLLCLQLWLWVQGSAQELDPNGRNVCKVGR